MQFNYIGNQSKKDVRLASSFANGAFVTANASASFANGAFLRANSGYGVANSGSSFANGAFVTANSGASFANAAFDRANAAFAQANTSSGSSAPPITVYSDVFTANGSTTTFNLSTTPTSENYITAIVDGITQLRSTYTVTGNVVIFDSAFEAGANVEVTTITGGSSLDPYSAATANGAFDRANAAYNAANTGGSGTDSYARDTANAAFITANAAFLQANNSTDTWVRTQANNAYDKANSGASFANGAFVTSNSSASFANAAFDRANAAYTQANTGGSGTDAYARNTANAGFITANSASSFANGAFTTANNALPKSGGTITGNVIFSGTNANLHFSGAAARITSDFSNATIASRTMFQTSTTDGVTNIYAIPNGTGATTTFSAVNNSNPTNAGIVQVGVNATGAFLLSTRSGSGTYLPFYIQTNGTDKLTVGADTTGTYTFGGTAPKIRGDFSNATLASRAMFQSSTTNGTTNIYAVPNGTATGASWAAYNDSDPTNASYINIVATATDHRITSGLTGTGSYLPFTIYTGGSERFRIDTSGNASIPGTLIIQSTTASTSNTTGAFEVIGGVGIQGNLYTGAIRVTGPASNGITFADGTTQYTANVLDSWVRGTTNASFLTANSGASFANAAFDRANASYTKANTTIIYTASSTAPSSPKPGDQWYLTTTDVLYEYINDGTSNNWVDIISPTMSNNSTGSGGTSVAKVVGYNLVFGG